MMRESEAIARHMQCIRELGNCYCAGYTDRACYVGPVKVDAPPRGHGLATVSQVIGIVSLVMWPLGGLAVVLALAALARGRRRSETVETRALIGLVTGLLSSCVVIAGTVLLALHPSS